MNMADFITSDCIVSVENDGDCHASQPLLSSSRSSGSPSSPRRHGSIRHVGPLLSVIRTTPALSSDAVKQLTEADSLLRKGRHSEAVSCLEIALLTANPGPALQSLLWRLLGNSHLSLGQYKKASICFMHHLAFCRQLGDIEGVGHAECNLGISYMRLGMLKLAGRCFLQYLENCRDLQDALGIAKALSNLGVLSKTLAVQAYEAGHRDDGNFRENVDANLKRAIAYFEQHLEIVEGQRDAQKQARVYGNLGSCHEMLQQYPQAIFCYGKRLELVRATGDRKSECCALCSLGNCCRVTNRLEEAIERYEESLELSRSIDNGAGEIASLLNLAVTCELLERQKNAIEWYTLYLSATVQYGDVSGQIRALTALALLNEETGEIKKAEIYYRKVIEVFHQLGDRKGAVMAGEYLASMQKSTKKNRKTKSKRKPRLNESLETNDMSVVKRGQGKHPLWFRAMQHWRQSPYITGKDSTLILENRAAFVGTATFGHYGDTDNLYNNESIMQSFFEHEAVNSLYHLWDPPAAAPVNDSPILRAELSASSRQDRPLPEEPENDLPEASSMTGYATIGEHFAERHLKELKRVSRNFSGPINELGIESTDREWKQWLHIQEMVDDSVPSRVGSNVEMTTFGKRPQGNTRGASSVPQSLSLDVL